MTEGNERAAMGNGAAVLLAVAVLVAAADITVAEGRPDFCGRWRMDPGAAGSTSLDALLESQGFSWLERKAADTMAVTQTIEQTGTKLTIRVQGGGADRVEILLLDGSMQVRETKRLGKVETHSSWEGDGKTLCTVTTYTTPDGHRATWVQRRYLVADGRSLRVDHLVTIDDGRRISARRVLRRL
jgi:hypothetical protein